MYRLENFGTDMLLKLVILKYDDVQKLTFIETLDKSGIEEVPSQVM